MDKDLIVKEVWNCRTGTVEHIELTKLYKI